MARLRIAASAVAVSAALVGAAVVVAAAPRRQAFTLHNASFGLRNHRLTYAVTICTKVKSVLTLTSTFTPVGARKGARTLTPGATQYQDRGCWPAFVSAPVATVAGRCDPISCPAIIGRRYRVSVLVTDKRSRQSRRAPRLQAVA